MSETPTTPENLQDLLRNTRAEMPQLSLQDLMAIRETLLLAATEVSVGAPRLARHLGVSDAYANQLLLSLCAANLLFINHGECSLEGALCKAVERHVAKLNQFMEARDGQR